MTQSQVAPTDLLRERLQNDIDRGIVVTDGSEIPVYTSDVSGKGTPPALVVRPTVLQQVSSIVNIATSMGFAITQRGGGMSYTGGYLPTRAKTVMLDLSALNRIISISDEDLVITVEAGVTWQQIWEALTPRGLRLPFFGTFSGSYDGLGQLRWRVLVVRRLLCPGGDRAHNYGISAAVARPSVGYC